MSNQTIEITNGAKITETRKDELLSRFGYEIGNQVTIKRTGQDATITGAIVIKPNFDSFGLGKSGMSTIYIQIETEDGTEMRVDSIEIMPKPRETRAMTQAEIIKAIFG